MTHEAGISSDLTGGQDFDRGSGFQEEGDKPEKSSDLTRDLGNHQIWQGIKISRGDTQGKNIIRFGQGSGSQAEGDKPKKSQPGIKISRCDKPGGTEDGGRTNNPLEDHNR